ncbi:DUF2235 domain-containing protein [Siccibacter turicensis]|uniref:Uncharacterized protein n=1 Tax=Siccibacter turicensis TaxID=357233 RepID=A0A2P8VE77_9ENTR|nr:DUF2235 domain-containing protein [Siccibacter turicensis]PSN05853.1 hypothetical protein C7G83_19865 [Siccibacter turicensis]
MDWDDLKYRVACEESRHEAGVNTCSLTLNFGIFFDCRERNIVFDEDRNHVTNIGRLFRAHPQNITPKPQSSSVNYGIYIPGLGSTLDDSDADRLYSIMDARVKALPDDYTDALVDEGKETAVDAIKGVFKGDWSQVLSNKLEDLLTMKSNFKATVSAIKSAAGRVVAEATPPIRDNPLVASVLMTGVDARIDYAKNNFKFMVADIVKANQLPIKLIQVSVFGADLGAALARRFIDELLDSVCKKVGDEYWYEDSKVEIIFAGFFDCTRRSIIDPGDTASLAGDVVGLVAKASPLKLIGTALGAKVIDYDKPLHPAVKKALHLVAAHERRDYRPLLPLGPLRAGWREELYPGVSEDVTGGLLPNEQRPSAELCRVPLREMYDTARRAQVPFPNFTRLYKDDRYIASYFVMLDNLAGHSARDYCKYYRDWVGSNGVTPEAFEKHIIHYCVWLGMKLYEYRTQRQSYGLFELDKKAELNEQWGWLNKIWYDAEAILKAPGVSYKLKQAAKLVRYYQPGNWIPPAVDMFFNYFMHDFSSQEMKSATLDAQSDTMISSNNFFASRSIETLSDAEKTASSQSTSEKPSTTAVT